MGWFSKETSETSLFEEIFVKNIARIWDWPTIWFTDQPMVPLKKSGIISASELEQLDNRLLPVLGLGEALVTQSFEAKIEKKYQVADEGFDLRRAYLDAFPETQFWPLDNGTLGSNLVASPLGDGCPVPSRPVGSPSCGTRPPHCQASAPGCGQSQRPAGRRGGWRRTPRR